MRRPDRAGDLSRPFRLSPWTIIAGVAVTVAMFLMLGLGVGDDSGGIEIPAQPADAPARLGGDLRAPARFPGYEAPEWWSLVLVDRDGNLRDAVPERRDFSSPRFSPDGRRVSVDFTGDDGRDVWILSPGGGSRWRATFDRDGRDASWHPDGSHIVYTSWRHGSLGIWAKGTGSDAPADSILTHPALAETGEWSPDSAALVTSAADSASVSSFDVVAIVDRGRRVMERLVSDRSSARFPALSPDGRWLAYVSNRSGADEVYLRPWRRDGGDIRVSQGGGTEPVWNPRGNELFYRGRSGRGEALVAASLVAGGGSPVGSREVLFALSEIARGGLRANYDVSPDGMIFVMIRRNPER